MTTLSDLISQARLLSNMEESQFVTDAELTTYLNWGLSALDDLIVTLFEDYKKTSVQATITTPVDGYNSFPLPVDFLKGRGLDRQFGGVWHTMNRSGMPGRNSGQAFGGVFSVGPHSYRIEDSKVIIEPWQNCTGVYQLHYIPRFVPLVNTTDTVQDYMNQQSWCQFAVIDCVIKILAKQDMDASQWVMQKNDLYQRITNAASIRDAGPAMSAEKWRRGGRGFGHDGEW